MSAATMPARPRSHARSPIQLTLFELPPPRTCDTCDEAAHLLGSDTLAGVAIRLGYRNAPNLITHLQRHGHAALVNRYRILTP